MNIVEFAEKTSPMPLSEWQKQLLASYEQAKKDNKHLRVVTSRISGRQMLMQIIQEFEKEFEQMEKPLCEMEKEEIEEIIGDFRPLMACEVEPRALVIPVTMQLEQFIRIGNEALAEYIKNSKQ